MCFHSKLTAQTKTVEARFNARFETEEFHPQPRYNGFTFPETPVITNEDEKLIQMYSWGLMPSWSKDDKFRVNTLNARIETLTEKPSFKTNVKNRCLILADGFFEWQWLDQKGKQKQQYLITLPDGAPFAFAGIYSHWKNASNGTVLKTYTIITTEANELMAQIHNTKKRMPVILNPSNEKLWLAGAEIMQFSEVEVELSTTPTLI